MATPILQFLVSGKVVDFLRKPYLLTNEQTRISNPHNMCFLNVVVQILLSTTKLRILDNNLRYLLGAAKDNKLLNNSDVTTVLYKNVICDNTGRELQTLCEEFRQKKFAYIPTRNPDIFLDGLLDANKIDQTCLTTYIPINSDPSSPFPLLLDLYPEMCETPLLYINYTRALHQQDGSILNHDMSLPVKRDVSIKTENGATKIMHLIGVICPFDPRGGHYICYCLRKSSKTGKNSWFWFSDGDEPIEYDFQDVLNKINESFIGLLYEDI